MAEIGEDITKAIKLLKSGEIIGIPTETVYGLAGNALDVWVLSKIFETKNRPKFDPLISHVDSLEKVKKLVSEIPEKAGMLAEEFWPGPLTLLLKKNREIPDLLTSGFPKMAIRIPNHPLTLSLLKNLDFPLAAPSANPFGFVSPTQASHVNDQLGGMIKYILDGGSCQIGLESTVIGFKGEAPIVHRLGGLTIEKIEACVGSVQLALNKSSNPDAPGQLQSHYSPNKLLIVGDIEEELAKFKDKNIGIISFCKNYGLKNQIILSESSDLAEAARGIFSALRNMAQWEVDLIITQKFPNVGLGRAINDRLERASV